MSAEPQYIACNCTGMCRPREQGGQGYCSSTVGQARPRWSPVDDDTADLLELVAMGSSTGTADHEWEFFVEALRDSALYVNRLSEHYPIIDPNALRRLVRDHVAPRRIGAFTSRAVARGLIEATGEWEVSDDTQGRNAGRPARVYRWIGGEL